MTQKSCRGEPVACHEWLARAVQIAPIVGFGRETGERRYYGVTLSIHQPGRGTEQSRCPVPRCEAGSLLGTVFELGQQVLHDPDLVGPSPVFAGEGDASPVGVQVDVAQADHLDSQPLGLAAVG